MSEPVRIHPMDLFKLIDSKAPAGTVFDFIIEDKTSGQEIHRIDGVDYIQDETAPRSISKLN